MPATITCQRAVDAMGAFERLGGDVIVKPLFGSEGFGMMRISDGDLARRAFAALERVQSVIYVQRFVPHGGGTGAGTGGGTGGGDLRLFVIDGQVTAAMRRTADDWRTNIACGGRGEPFDPDAALRDLAVRAAAACDAVVAGVDLLIGDDGDVFVLEVNASPGWQALSAVTGVDIAARIIACVERRVAEAMMPAADATTSATMSGATPGASHG